MTLPNKRSESALSYTEFCELFACDPNTGKIVKKDNRGVPKGKSPDRGWVEEAGYARMIIKGKRYLKHRLVWLYVHRVWPDGFIDHINGDRLDNRISNLRLATRSQNRANSKKNKGTKSAYKGAYWVSKHKRWHAVIVFQRRRITLGYFNTAEEAHAEYKNAAKKYFGEFARFG